MADALQPCVDFAAARRAWEQLNEEGELEDVHQVFFGFAAWAGSDVHARPLPLLAAYEGAECVALLPVRRRWRRMGGLKLGVLETAGNDHWRLSMPILGRDAQRSMAALLEGLRALRGWDMLEIGPMLETSRAAELLVAEGRRQGLRPQLAGEWEDPVVRLEGSFEQYYASRSANLRSQAKRGEARLAREGPVVFEEYRGGEELDRRMEEFFRVEASGWKGREGTAILASPALRRFYLSLARQAAERDWLRLHALRAGGHCVAADFCLAFRGTVYMLKVGYDEVWSHCSPGQVMRRCVIEHLFQCGMEEIYDLMAGGGEHRAYKLRWANQFRPCMTVRLFNPHGVKGRVAAGASRLRAWLRGRQAAAPDLQPAESEGVPV